MRFGRTSGLVVALIAGAFTVTACEPQPPAGPSVRGLRFDITRGGPLVVGADLDGNPIELTSTPPVVEAGSNIDGCDPIGESSQWSIVRQPWSAPDGTVYDAWVVTSGSYTVIVPGDAKCIPTKDGKSTYVVAALADTANDDGSFGGKALGFAADERLAAEAGEITPLFKIVK